MHIHRDTTLSAEKLLRQRQLADAYLAAGQGAERRVFAKSFVLRAAWERAGIEHCPRALSLCQVPDRERTIADFLSADSSATLEDL